MTDLAKSFFNAFSEVFNEICDMNTLNWFYCAWHFIRAFIKAIENKKFGPQIDNKIKNYFFYLLYARSIRDFEEEKIRIFDFIKFSLKSLETVTSDKKKLGEFLEYIENKFKDQRRWAYCFRIPAEVSVNMAIKRFHKELKDRFPKNGPPTVDILFIVLITYGI